MIDDMGMNPCCPARFPDLVHDTQHIYEPHYGYTHLSATDNWKSHFRCHIIKEEGLQGLARLT